MTDRPSQIAAFLAGAGWGDARLDPLKGDASTRRYTRLHLNGRTAILMDQPQGAETAACPPGASPAERQALGYNALARLAGANVRAFMAIAQFLCDHGFSAPRLLAADPASGLLLLEDLGDALYARAIAEGAEELPLYAHAIDALAALHAIPAPSGFALADGSRHELLAYDEAALIAETELLLDWFYPAAMGQAPSADLRAEWRVLWREALSPVLAAPPVLVLRDYHAENLIWLPERTGVARVGLLDFQDGLSGAAAYDLISLTEDARRDVAPELAEATTARYVAARQAADPGFAEAPFREAVAVLAAQRNTKIIGIFTRLWTRDGKPRYPGYHPRLWRYMDRDLSHPALGPLKTWFDRHVPADIRLSLVRVAERET